MVFKNELYKEYVITGGGGKCCLKIKHNKNDYKYFRNRKTEKIGRKYTKILIGFGLQAYGRFLLLLFSPIFLSLKTFYF